METQGAEGETIQHGELMRFGSESRPKIDRFNREEAQENRRRHIRIPIAMIAHATPKGLRILTKVFVRDISTHGMGGYTILPFNKGQVLQVDLKIERSGQGPIRGVLSGEIRWSTLVDKGKRYAFGLAFHDRAMAREQPLLYRYLKELEEMFHPQE